VAFLAIGLTRRRSFWGAVFLILTFTVLVGFPASAVRAAIMSILVLFALQIGRMGRVTNLIIFTAAVMMFANPRVLRDDVGFQLSFLAVLGIVYFYPKFNKYLENIKNKIFKLLLSIIFLTLSAQILTLPVMAYNFRQIALISPISNLLVLWAIPPAMLFSFLAIILSLFINSWAVLIFAPASILLTYVIMAVDLCSRFPYSYVEVGNFGVVWLLIYYILAIYFLWGKNSLNLLSRG
jgi:competence protein ComEC